ncbi:MAG: amino acid synthesis family protein, partial [Trebonia sp.]
MTISATHTLVVRKIWSQVDQTETVVGRRDDGGPLRKVAVCAVVENPYAAAGFVADLTKLIDGSGALGKLLGDRAVALL